MGPSWTRDQTQVSCIGRQILNRCSTSEAPSAVSSKALNSEPVSVAGGELQPAPLPASPVCSWQLHLHNFQSMALELGMATENLSADSTGNTWPSEANVYMNVFLIRRQARSFQAEPAQQFICISGGAWDSQGEVKPRQAGRQGDQVKALACLGSTQGKAGITNTE